ncbi:hypothetical protein ACFLZI_03670 [Nitrospirota bacterium]
MKKCEHHIECAFYKGQMFKTPESFDFLKQLYCHNKNEKCSRLINSGDYLVKEPRNLHTPLGWDSNLRID